MHRALAIMARTPEPGRTKTRLQKALGVEGALRAHQTLVLGTLARMSGLRDIHISLWVTRLAGMPPAWSQAGPWAVHEQPPGDIGQRMQAILSTLLAQGADAACVIGTDCPPINAAYVEAAFAALAQADVVVGPAEDGGYGLIGLQQPAPTLFENIAWGTPAVYTQTRAQAKSAQLCVVELPQIWDVDTPDDWRRFQRWSGGRG